MQGYIIVMPEGVLLSEERAERISRELYCVTAPLVTQEPYQNNGEVFGIVAHPDGVQFAMQVDTAYSIPVSPLATLERLISLMTEMSEIELRNLSAYVLNSSSFPFGAIVPSTTTVRTYEQMVELGWFTNPEEVLL